MASIAYFSPGRRLSLQPQSVTVMWPVPDYSDWWQIDKSKCVYKKQQCSKSWQCHWCRMILVCESDALLILRTQNTRSNLMHCRPLSQILRRVTGLLVVSQSANYLRIWRLLWIIVCVRII